MVECTRSDVADGCGWKCSSCLTLQTWITLLHFWSRQNPVYDTAECAKVSPNTAVDVYQWLREVCSTRLINDGPVVLGGVGVVVQIDESLFKHKPKVQSVKRVYVFMRVLFCNFISTVPPRKTGRLRAVGFWHG